MKAARDIIRKSVFKLKADLILWLKMNVPDKGITFIESDGAELWGDVMWDERYRMLSIKHLKRGFIFTCYGPLNRRVCKKHTMKVENMALSDLKRLAIAVQYHLKKYEGKEFD